MRFLSLPGLTDYADARALQLQLVEERARDEVPDTILFLEHAPVITRGRGLQYTGDPKAERYMPAPTALPPEIAFSETERGGDLTYHGPGQLVVYPIVKLDGRGYGPERDVTAFLRKLEGTMIAVLEELGITAGARAQATGVWVGEQKLASIGIAVRRWVTYHGLAVNAVNDLAPFHLISPCGFKPEVMTRVADLLPEATRPKFQASWRETLEGLWRAKLTAAQSLDSPRFENPAISLS